jgi:hypothetical protein
VGALGRLTGRISSALDLFDAAADIARADAAAGWHRGAELGPLSPWATKRHLATIAWDADAFGSSRDQPPTVADALRVPAIKKGRAILHAVLGSAPLVAIRNDAGVDTVLAGKDAPTWLYRSDTEIAPETRMAAILDDLLFYEAALLVVKRGRRPDPATRGTILDAVHVPYDWWSVDPESGVLRVNDIPMDPDAVLWIPGPSQGLLVEARAEIRQWLDMASNIARRLASPAPSIILEDSDTGDADDDEIDDMVARVAAARRSPDGGVMYVPAGIKATAVQSNDDSALYIQARNALRIDLANHLNLPVALLDGSPATASLTYSTAEGKRSEFDDLSLDYWTTPITAALSQDVVVPRGTRIRFDFSSRYAATNAPTGAPALD